MTVNSQLRAPHDIKGNSVTVNSINATTGMSNDFRSLLSTFQAATTGQKPSSTSSSSLLEATTQLWRLSQLQTSMNTLNAKSDGDSAPSSPLHLAVCLCIVDDLPHEEIWKYWMQDGAAELYLHAKHPEKIKSDWARSKLISISHNPNWNDVRIVKAMLSLAQEALKDERTSHFYFGTESCLPIVELSEISLQPNKSYLSYYGKEQATRFEERECWSPVEVSLPSDAIYKALPGWCVLSRNHMQAISDIHFGDVQLWQAFEKCWAPEEVYFATALSLLGLLNDKEVVKKSLVHAEWNERARNHQDRAHPKEYDQEFGEGLVRHLRNKGSVFLRKVKHRMPLHRWKRVVLCEQDRNGEPQDCDGRRRPASQGSNGRPASQDGNGRRRPASQDSNGRPASQDGDGWRRVAPQDSHHAEDRKRPAPLDSYSGDRRHYRRDDYYETQHRRRRLGHHNGRDERSQCRHGR